ncbi:DUF4169 family protein [Roseovarius sp. Pro17]|uniref:DUF4169 family protein n=1 Tax=Roseovarius sp. Pro17 TaxID=3108175 RepID=UPI002D76617E|nr:DUF4169 family protein [Roseovarius sp. Pro17]
MTGAPINLNRARKDRARAEDKTRADENAVRFGRTKAQKTAERTEADRAARLLDDHQREE